MKLIQNDIELPNGRNDDISQESSAIGIEESIKSTADGVITNNRCFLGIETEALAGERAYRLLLPVDRLTLNKNGS